MQKVTRGTQFVVALFLLLLSILELVVESGKHTVPILHFHIEKSGNNSELLD